MQNRYFILFGTVPRLLLSSCIYLYSCANHDPITDISISNTPITNQITSSLTSSKFITEFKHFKTEIDPLDIKCTKSLKDGHLFPKTIYAEKQNSRTDRLEKHKSTYYTLLYLAIWRALHDE